MTRPPFKAPLEPAAVERVWQRLAERGRRPAWGWRPLLALTVGLGVLAAVRLAAPRAPTAAVAQPAVVDASSVTPAASAVVAVVRDTPDEFRARQREGRCDYVVDPRRRRPWVVEVPGAKLEAHDAQFTVSVDAQGAELVVERGSVTLTQGATLRTVFAGERLRLEPVRAVDEGQATRPPAPPPAAPSRPPAPRPPAPVPTPAPAPAAAAEVLAQAEASLAGGELDAARNALEAWLALAPRDNDWAVVGLRLGLLEQAHQRPSAALRWFEAVAGMRGPPSAVEDASAQRVLALRQLDRAAEAERALDQLKQRWPHSAWLLTLDSAP